MSAISPHRLKQVRSLIKVIPDGPLRSLDGALALSNDAALQEVRRMIVEEREQRHARLLIFAPFIPLFEVRDDDLNSVIFPRWLLSHVWRALEKHEPELYAEAHYIARGLSLSDPPPVVFFRLVNASADLLRNRADEMLPAVPKKDDAAEIAEFAHYLDLHRIVRDALLKMPNWLGRIDAERAAELRVLYKDACNKSEDSGARFMELLFANLEDGVQIMKLIAAVVERPNDRFLAESELADFGERILELVEERVMSLKTQMEQAFKLDNDPHAIGRGVASCLGHILALENAIELSREGPWGQRVAAARKTIATCIETRIKQAEKSIANALPTKVSRGGLPRPRLDKPLDERELGKAQSLMLFMSAVRGHAAQGGFAGLHAKTFQAIEVQLDSYLQDLLSLANGEEAADPATLGLFFDALIGLIDAALGAERANLARRRVASTALFKTQDSVA